MAEVVRAMKADGRGSKGYSGGGKGLRLTTVDGGGSEGDS